MSADGFEPHAELHDWMLLNGCDNQFVTGVIFNDKKGRFANGTRVRTSPVVALHNGQLATRNTRYLLVNRLVGDAE